MKHLIGMELGLDVCQNLITFDAWELLGSFEDVSIQLQHLGLRRHAVWLAYVPWVSLLLAFFAFT